MSKDPNDKETLVRQIEEAFDEGSPSPPNPVVEKVPYLDLECRQIAAIFQGRNWRDISHETLWVQSAALSFFTPEAYNYYLPAYLRAAILHYDEVDVLPDSIVYSLCPSKEVELRDRYFQKRVSTFTPPSTRRFVLISPMAGR